MKRVFILLCLMLGVTCSYAANSYTVPDFSVNSTSSSNNYTIHAAGSDSNGQVSLSADSSGYAGTTAYATCSGTQPTRYEWSATFTEIAADTTFGQMVREQISVFTLILATQVDR